MSQPGSYRLGVWPVGYHPNRRRKWWRLAVVVVVLVGAVPAVSLARWLPSHVACRDGWPSGEVWSQDGECVGVTEGPYAFELDQFTRVMAVIDEQNRTVRDHGCRSDHPIVTIAVLTTFTSPHGGGRMVQELEGFAAAQRRANGAGCRFPVRLKVANTGRDAQAAEALARRLKDDPSVLAVVGMGLSDQRSADAADVLGSSGLPVPMVADLITASGFDADGSKADSPDFGTCDQGATYRDGVGHGYFYRVAHRTTKQISVLSNFLSGPPDLLITPTDERDPYTCTSLPFARKLGNDVQEVRFDPQDSRTVAQAAEQVCRRSGGVTAFYTARSRDLGRFLHRIVDQRHNGQCVGPSAITVVSTSDAVRMRVPEAEKELEASRMAVLESEMFRLGRLRLVYTPLADADSLKDNPEFGTLRRQFVDLGFEVAHLEGGWAVNAYDSLRTVTEAIQTLSGDEPSRAQINAAINGIKGSNRLLGAGGPIEFDNSNNRTSDPVAVELCPGQGGGRPFSVPVASTEPCR
ncbi:ABC transporter substrate-binding protein [Saccharothrix sp. NPDC042600]|uniref:ABC transporter substrate-binding protein n=1 Tax=Saccharothrix TaxID=2071 RepID=UPI0033D491AE